MGAKDVILIAVVSVICFLHIRSNQGAQLNERGIVERDGSHVVKRAFRQGVQGKVSRSRIQTEAALRDKLGLDARYTLEWQRAGKMASGSTKARLRQLFLGIPVFDTSLVVEQDPQTLEYFEDSIMGSWYSRIEDDIRKIPAILSVQDAITAFKLFNGHRMLKSQNDVATLQVSVTRYTRAVLTYRVGYYLGYETVNVSATNLTDFPARLIGVLDATTGEVYESWNGLSRAQIVNSIQGITGNTETGDKLESFFILKESTTNECFYSRKIGGKTLTLYDYRKSTENVAKFICTDAIKPTYDSTNGALSPMNSAFKYASEAMLLFDNLAPLTLPDIKIIAHYPGLGAAWTGDSVHVSDGDASSFYPFTEADIIGHEVAHSFTEYASGLDLKDQPGAINEAFSDMAGVALLDRVFKKQVFEIGQTITKSELPLRDLCNPPRVGGGLDHTSKLTNPVQLYPASGIYSKAFCVLAKSLGWDIYTAFQVFTQANSLYWGPSSTFAKAACGVQTAAMDLGRNEQDVIKSFATVGVKCAP